MGCLPGLVLFLLAIGVGWMIAGANGVLWGAVIGVATGSMTTALMLMLLRRASRRGSAPGGKAADK